MANGTPPALAISGTLFDRRGGQLVSRVGGLSGAELVRSILVP